MGAGGGEGPPDQKNVSLRVGPGMTFPNVKNDAGASGKVNTGPPSD